MLIGIFWGFMCDRMFFRNENAHEHINIHGMCEEEHCHCEKGIWGSSLKHALKIALFILVISAALNLLIDLAGADALAGTIVNHKVFGPLIASRVGLIPNCASSVILTQMYLEGVIGVGAMMAGLLTGAGVGWLVLFRASRNVKKTLKVIGLVYVFGAVSGMIIGLFF